MAIYRTHTRTDHYKTIDNAAAEDDRLSWKAKGLHWYCLTLPDDWTFYQTELTAHAKDGKAALASAVRELVKYGYWNKTTTRVEGRFETHYDIWENPLDNAEFQRDIDGTGLAYRRFPPRQQRKSFAPVSENQQRRENRVRKSATDTVSDFQQRQESPETGESYRVRFSATENQQRTPCPIFSNGKSDTTKKEKTKKEDLIRSDDSTYFFSENSTTRAQLQSLYDTYNDARPPFTRSRLQTFCQQHHISLTQLTELLACYGQHVRQGGRYLGYIHKVLENQGGVNSVPQAQPYGKAEPAPLPIGADTWTHVLQQIHRRMEGNPAYSMWIRPLVPCTMTPARWCFQVPDAVFIHQVTDCYLPLLQEEIHAITGTTPTIDFVVHSQQEAA